MKNNGSDLYNRISGMAAEIFGMNKDQLRNILSSAENIRNFLRGFGFSLETNAIEAVLNQFNSKDKESSASAAHLGDQTKDDGYIEIDNEPEKIKEEPRLSFADRVRNSSRNGNEEGQGR